MTHLPRSIAYLHRAPFPAPRVSNIQVARMCDAFADLGLEVCLIALNPTTSNVQFDPKTYFGTKHAIPMVRLPLEQRRGHELTFALRATSIALARKASLVYTRCPYTAALALRRGLTTIFEEHELPRRILHQYVRRRLIYPSPHLRATVFISHSLQRLSEERGHLARLRAPSIVAHDAAPEPQLSQPTTSRAQPPLSVAYSGSLNTGRGLDLIRELAARLPDLRFYIIGGDACVSHDKAPTALPSLPNLTYTGYIHPGGVADLLRQMDILLMPYQQTTQTRAGVNSSAWMSPMKLGEYMASGVPIVSSDLPVLREILTHLHNALLVSPPDDPASWTSALEKLIDDPDLRYRLAANALEQVKQGFTWKKRAQRILTQSATLP